MDWLTLSTAVLIGGAVLLALVAASSALSRRRTKDRKDIPHG